MKSLPEIDRDGMVNPWNVREATLSTGRAAAMHLEKWDQALSFNADVLESKRARKATDLEGTQTAFNDYGPLPELERYDEAEGLLLRCQEVFERENDVEMLGKVFSALADLEARLGHLPQALDFDEKALRYNYTQADPGTISTSHNNLANCLFRAGSKSVLAHSLASEIIDYQTGSGEITLPLGNLAIVLKKFGPDALPGSFDDICNEVEKVEGVHFRELFERLPKRAKDGEEALNAVMNVLMEMLKSQGEN